MGRKERQRKKTFVIFCEGKTEYNYFGAVKSVNIDIVLKPVNMGGGGYKSFLEIVKKNGNINMLSGAEIFLLMSHGQRPPFF